MAAFHLIIYGSFWAITEGFLAGANSIFYGETLLTTPNPTPDQDSELLRERGLKPMPQAAHAH